MYSYVTYQGLRVTCKTVSHKCFVFILLQLKRRKEVLSLLSSIVTNSVKNLCSFSLPMDQYLKSFTLTLYLLWQALLINLREIC